MRVDPRYQGCVAAESSRLPRLVAESLTWSARCTAPAPGTLDWPMMLSRSRSVRPVPTVAVLLHPASAINQHNRPRYRADASSFGDWLMAEWYEDPAGLTSGLARLAAGLLLLAGGPGSVQAQVDSGSFEIRPFQFADGQQLGELRLHYV